MLRSFQVSVRLFCLSLLSLTCISVSVQADSGAQADDDQLLQRYQEADTVALVKIKYVSGLVNRAMSMPGMMAVEAFSYHAEVSRNWKGAGNRMISFQVSLADCTQRLQEDEEYVILSHANKQDEQQSFSCDNLVPKSSAEQMMAGLDSILSTKYASQNIH